MGQLTSIASKPSGKLLPIWVPALKRPLFLSSPNKRSIHRQSTKASSFSHHELKPYWLAGLSILWRAPAHSPQERWSAPSRPLVSSTRAQWVPYPRPLRSSHLLVSHKQMAKIARRSLDTASQHMPFSAWTEQQVSRGEFWLFTKLRSCLGVTSVAREHLSHRILVRRHWQFAWLGSDIVPYRMRVWTWAACDTVGWAWNPLMVGGHRHWQRLSLVCLRSFSVSVSKFPTFFVCEVKSRTALSSPMRRSLLLLLLKRERVVIGLTYCAMTAYLLLN